jgi:aminomethyltransferase
MQWREWSGYFASSVYADFHDIEYNAIREAAALIDVSPLFKYEVSGRDAERLIDDGTVHRLAEDRFRWTAADPQLRWLRQNAVGLDVAIEETTEKTASVALQGPLSRDVLEAAAGESFADLRYFRRRGATIAGVAVDVSRTGYTGDLGYELWVDTEHAVALWDALMAAGADYAIRPAGMVALDVVRLEAGLILLEVDYTSARHAMNAEQAYSPAEIGLGRLVDLDKGPFVGQRALAAEARAGGPARRLVGLEVEWAGIEALHAAQDLPPTAPAVVSRASVPVFDGGRQVGRATSTGWSPILKKPIALASVSPAHERIGSRLSIEWTVEGRRGRVNATVVELPFLDLPRKRA